METTNARKEVAANVRALMGRGVGDTGKRVTQKQLGAVLGLSQGPISERLSGSQAFTFDELITIAGFFDVPLSRLFEGVSGPSEQGISRTIWEADSDQVVSGPRAYDVSLFADLELAA